jgi:OOP family OmpA-OmpF porin
MKMIPMIKLTTVGVLGLALAGCGAQLEKAKMMQPEGGSSMFSKNLYTGYVDLAKSEYDEADYADSDFFADKAMAASQGGAVGPQDVSARALPADRAPVLSGARQRLMAALQANGAERAPDQAARAQVMFDCWMQEQEENIQPEDIAACQAGFTDAIAKLESALAPKMAEKAPEPAPQPAPEPMAKPAMQPKAWMVFFDFDSANVTGEADAKVREAAMYAMEHGAVIKVRGHTDRAGSNAYNAKLARERARMIADTIAKIGVPASQIQVGAFGEGAPMVKTPDGTREAKNRRVEISVTEN